MERDDDTSAGAAADVDLSLIDWMLGLTADERLAVLDDHVRTVRALRGESLAGGTPAE